jgi:hypothetical protein
MSLADSLWRRQLHSNIETCELEDVDVDHQFSATRSVQPMGLGGSASTAFGISVVTRQEIVVSIDMEGASIEMHGLWDTFEQSSAVY